MRNLFASVIVAGALLSGCGAEDTLKEKAQIETDRSAIGFGQEVGNANYVGTEPIETLQLRNGGKEALNISLVSITGANAALFKATLDKTTVEGGKRAFVQIVYEPVAAGSHSAVLEITSNAENTPLLKVNISASAVDKK